MAATKLDVDDSLFRSKLLLESHPEFSNPEQEISQLFPEAPTNYTTIKPKPGICIKTRKTNDDPSKVFINVCTCSQVPAPDDITQQQLLDILESDEASSFRIPMSIGAPHEEKDKSGEPCTAYDVVINDSFLEKIRDDPLFNTFFVTTTTEAIENKYDVQLDKNGWKVLLNKQYYGKLSEQAIKTAVPLVRETTGKLKPTATITEVVEPEINKKTYENLLTPINTKKISNSLPKFTEPPYSIHRIYENANSTIISKLKVEIKLTGLISKDDVDVYCGEDSLVLKHRVYSLNLPLPFLIKENDSFCYFALKEQLLVVYLPVDESAAQTSR